MLLLWIGLACNPSEGGPKGPPPGGATSASPTLGFEIHGDLPVDGLAVSLDVIQDDDASSWFAGFPATAADMTVIPGRPRDDLLTVGDDGVATGTFVVGLFEDAGADGVRDEGETIVGMSEVLALWCDEPVPAVYADKGAVSGWNAILPDGDTFSLVSATSIYLPQNLVHTPTMSMAGTFNGDTSTTRIMVAYTGEGVAISPWMDMAATASWSVVIDGPPPDGHGTPVDDGGTPQANERVLGYEDAGDGAFNEGEPVLYAACLGTVEVHFHWRSPPTTADQAWELQQAGVTPGWRLRLDDGSDLDEANAQGLLLGANCLPE